MDKFADLHIHSTASDGSYTPKEIVIQAKSKGFSCIAITDHDTVDGVGTALTAGKQADLEIIPAVEMSTLYNGGVVHILGYYVDINNKQFLRTLADIARSRIERARQMVQKLQNLGISITWEGILSEESNTSSIGRPHVARALLKKGYIKDVGEAFTDEYIGKNGRAYVERYEITPAEAIHIITDAGGVPVLAHPGFFKKTTRLDREDIKLFVEQGLRGIEVYHTRHNQDDNDYYFNLAGDMNLLITGGSDCHGIKSGNLLLGRIKLPYQHVNNLKQAVGK